MSSAGDRCDDVATAFKTLSKYPYQYVIATIPDPIEATGGWMFDGQVAAITAALENQGWNRRDYHLSWGCRPPSSDNQCCKDQQSNPSGPPDILGLHARGIVYFERDVNSLPTHLALLLVGEGPTTGIDTKALAWAFDKSHLNSTNQCPEYTLRIIGPTFSGSIASLHQVIQDKIDSKEYKYTAFRVSSGTATADENKTTLIQNLGSAVQFKLAGQTESVLRKAAREYLRKHEIEPSDTVLLVESGSVYGASIKPGGDKSNGGGNLRLITFPMHIATLRNAAAVNSNEHDTTQASVESLRKFLPLDLVESTPPRDVLPEFSAAIQSRIDELTLVDSLSRLSDHEKIKAIGIIATDPLDKLYLTHLIRRHAPNLLIFTTGYELLYSHPDVVGDTYGVLIFSAFPADRIARIKMLNNISSSAVNEPAESLLSGSMMMGAYKATIDVLDDLKWAAQPCDEVGPNNSKAEISNNKSTGVDCEKKGVYVSAVGRGRLVDIDSFATPATDNPEKTQLDEKLPITSYLTLATPLLLLIGAVLIFHFRTDAILRRRSRLPTSPMLARVRKRFATANRVRRLRFRRRLARVLTHVASERRAEWLFALATGASVLVYLYFLFLLWRTWPMEQNTLVRLVDLGLGLSPAFAIFVCLFGAFWVMGAQATISVIRRDQRERPTMANWVKQSSSEKLADVPTRTRRLLQLIQRCEAALSTKTPWSSGTTTSVERRAQRADWLRIFVLLAGLVPAIFYGSDPLAPLEATDAWDNWFKGTLLLSLVCTYWAFLKFRETWIRMRDLLNFLTWGPLIWAFERVPPRFAGAFPWVRRIGADDIRALQRQQVSTLLSRLHVTADQLAPAAYQHSHLKSAIAELTSAKQDDWYARADQTAYMRDQRIFSLLSSIATLLLWHWGLGKSSAEKPTSGDVVQFSERRNARQALPLTLEAYSLASNESDDLWWRMAEDVVVLEITEFLNYIFRNLWILLQASAISVTTCFIGIVCYPIWPYGRLFNVASTMLFIFAVWAFAIILEINRNDLLSRIAKTTPNRLTIDWRFAKQAFYVVGPLTILVVAQIPGLSWLSSWYSLLRSFIH